MISYNQLDIQNKFPKRPSDYLLGFIHGFTFGLYPLSIYLLLKKYK